MLRSIPQLIAWSFKDHAILHAILREEPFDMIVSDNRFGFFNKETRSIYMTHQLHIMLPKGWRWAEGIAEKLHGYIWKRYDEVWIPDFENEQQSLADEMSHLKKGPRNVKYIGPLSRFATNPLTTNPLTRYDIVAVLSGLEPHRTLLEQDIVARYAGKKDQVLIVQGLPSRPNTRIKRGNITIVPYMPDEALATALMGAKHIIARSGYSTIMDFHALGILDKAELIPTPGQPEQEYLAQKHIKIVK